MFNLYIYTFFTLNLFVHSWQLLLNKLFTTDNTLHIKNSNNNFYMLWFVLYAVLFNKIFNNSLFWFYNSMLLCTIALFYWFNWLNEQKYVSHFFLLYMLTILYVQTKNILVFMFFAEMFSILTFLLMFFNIKYKQSKKINTTYFLINNVIITIMAVFTIIAVLNITGSTNYNIVFFCHDVKTNKIILFLFVTYITFKYGQGPAVLLKFKFYKGVHMYDIFIYLMVYLIFIWPALNQILFELCLIMDTFFKNIILVIFTLFVINCTLFYSGFIDFLVFSTWILIWYQIFFLMCN